MMRRLPPLNSLKAFEAAARHGSMQAAAIELCVTPAAVSQQVRTLECYLELPLFRRMARGLALTDEGLVYLREARHALDRLAAATEQLVEKRVAGVLRVSAIPSFASRWLVPRLDRFLALYPEVTLRLIEDVRPIDFGRDPFDIGLRYGAGDYPGLHVDLVAHELLYIVAAPGLRERVPLRAASDLLRAPLLHEAHDRLTESWMTWQPWFRELGVDRDQAADRGPRFNGTATLLQAAERGLGIAIGRSRLVEAELNRNVLVGLFGLARPSRLAYWAVSPPEVALLPRVAAFRSWLQAEAARRPARARPGQGEGRSLSGVE